MNSTLGATLAAATLSLGAVVAPAGPASADTVTITDPGTDDVWLHSYDPDTGDDVWTPAGSVVNTDVLTAKVSHTDERQSMRITYAELDKKADRPTYRARLKLPDGRIIWWWAWWFGGKMRFGLVVDRGDAVKCADFETTAHWKTDVITSSFSRSCLKDPKWVKFQGLADTKHMQYSDLQNSDGHDDAVGWSHRIKAG